MGFKDLELRALEVLYSTLKTIENIFKMRPSQTLDLLIQSETPVSLEIVASGKTFTGTVLAYDPEGITFKSLHQTHYFPRAGIVLEWEQVRIKNEEEKSEKGQEISESILESFYPLVTEWPRYIQGIEFFFVGEEPLISRSGRLRHFRKHTQFTIILRALCEAKDNGVHEQELANRLGKNREYVRKKINYVDNYLKTKYNYTVIRKDTVIRRDVIKDERKLYEGTTIEKRYYLRIYQPEKKEG